jgi:hypothetical protein
MRACTRLISSPTACTHTVTSQKLKGQCHEIFFFWFFFMNQFHPCPRVFHSDHSIRNGPNGIIRGLGETAPGSSAGPPPAYGDVTILNIFGIRGICKCCVADRSAHPVRFFMCFYHCWGSVTLWCGSGSADPYL